MHLGVLVVFSSEQSEATNHLETMPQALAVQEGRHKSHMALEHAKGVGWD